MFYLLRPNIHCSSDTFCPLTHKCNSERTFQMQPDPEMKKEVLGPTLAAKLALMLGLSPRDSLELSHIISAISESSQCLSDAMLPLDEIE